MIAADGTWGRIRATGPPNAPSLIAVLNVDARPMLAPNDAIQLELTVEYRPLTDRKINDLQQQPPPAANLNQSLSVVLQNAKSLVVSQAADPLTDRKIVVEVKATVLK